MTGTSSFTYEAIGVIRTPHTDPAATPRQPSFAEGVEGRVEILPGLEEGLRGLERFSHVYLIYALDRAARSSLLVKPYLGEELRGVFATRAPARPNAIGLSLVRLLGIDGATLRVSDVDMLDCTPLLDVKPYVANVDERDGATSGWLEDAGDGTIQGSGERKQVGSKRKSD